MCIHTQTPGVIFNLIRHALPPLPSPRRLRLVPDYLYLSVCILQLVSAFCSLLHLPYKLLIHRLFVPFYSLVRIVGMRTFNY